MEFKEKWFQREHVVSSSICPPAVRTVLIMVFYDPTDSADPFGVYIHPVVAIESRVVEYYGKKVVSQDEMIFDHLPRAALKRMGYKIESRRSELRPVFIDGELGLVALEEHHSYSAAIEAVACSWGPEEDQHKLAPTIEKLKKDVKRMKEDPQEVKA